MSHLSRLDTEVQRLLQTRRTAALGTLDESLRPHVSMVPYAVDGADAQLIVLVSALAAHTVHMQHRPDVSVLIADGEAVGQPVHALGRLTLYAQAVTAGAEGVNSLSDRDRLGEVYLSRFPDAAPIAQLPDFRYVVLRVKSVRQVAGFGAARDLPVDDFQRLLR